MIDLTVDHSESDECEGDYDDAACADYKGYVFKYYTSLNEVSILAQLHYIH